MHTRLKRLLLCGFVVAVLTCLFCFSASAFTYEGSVNDVDLSTYSINIGGTTLPLSDFPDGTKTTFDGSTYNHYMTVSQAAQYGISLSSNLWLRSAECMAFARYVYAALYYKYPATSTMDNYIASTINTSGSYAYIDMVSSPWSGGSYTAAQFESLIKSCYPGSVIRQGGHSMVIMSIFDDGLIVYDANGTYDYNVVDVRKYTWSGYISAYGSRAINALQIPSYYPGYTDSLGRSGGGAYDYELDITNAGTYKVINVSSYLNIRSGPATTYSVVGKAYLNDEFEVLGTYNGWAAIDYNGAAGWLSLSYLELIERALTIDGYLLNVDTAGTYEVYNTSKVNVRALPTTSSTDVGDLYAGTVVDVLGTYSTWAAIVYNGDYCWVHTNYLTPYVPKITVTFNANGGTASQTSGTYAVGSAFGSLPTATKAKRNLIGWFSGQTKYTSSSVVPSSDITLTAKWGLYSFIDVFESDWYFESVKYVYDSGVMNGLSNTEFQPGANLTRAMMAQILYNLAGKPAVASTSATFTDVKSTDWYFAAVEWCKANGVINGRDDGTFDPLTSISRQDMVTMIFRYVTNYLRQDTSNRGNLSAFTDRSDIDSYALDALQWAVAEGLVNGMDDGTLQPKSTATRAQVAKIMMAILKNQ